jgi:hypothetical protein
MCPYGYANMVSNDLLGEHFAERFEGLGGNMPDLEIDRLRDASGSTDQGNLSHEWPLISPTSGIFTAMALRHRRDRIWRLSRSMRARSCHLRRL